MGVVTGIFGGILRDVLCNKIPHVFRRDTELYATCSFAGAWVFIILIHLQISAPLATWVGTATIFGLRMLALRFRLTLPRP